MSPEELSTLYKKIERNQASSGFAIPPSDLERIKSALKSVGKIVREGNEKVPKLYQANLNSYKEHGHMISDSHSIRIGLMMPYKDIPLYLNELDSILRTILAYRLTIGK